MAVFGPTANVHSTSFFFSLPATTTLSAEADFTVPLAFLTGIFFISAGLSAFFSSAFGAAAGVWATATPTDPAANAIATSKAKSFFTAVTPPLLG